MSDIIEVGRWENKLLKISIWSIKIGKEFYFFSREVALALDYANPKEAVRDHIDPEDKMNIEDALGKDYKIRLQNFSTGSKNLPVEFFQKLKSNQRLTNEIGIYCLCMRSRKKKVKPFQKWIYKTIRTIRETGSYTLPNGPVNNPLDFVEKVSTFGKEEIETLQKNERIIETRDKETQTPRNSRSIERSIRELKIEIERIENNLKKPLRKISSDSSYSSPSLCHSSSDGV